MKKLLTITGMFNDVFTNYKDKESSISMIVDTEENCTCYKKNGRCLIHFPPPHYVLSDIKEKEDLGYITKAGIVVSDEIVRALMIPEEYFGKKEEIFTPPIKTPEYYIGVDSYNEEHSYCLAKKNPDKTVEILLSKSFQSEYLFKQEVENLAKYFNAQIVKDKL